MAILLATFCGCGGEGAVSLVPVRGEVFFGQEPAAGALIVLHPTAVEGIEWTRGYPHGVVADDGTFAVSAPPFGEGVPLGDYAVTITWPAPAAGADPSESDPELVDRLNGSWADPHQPRAKAVVAGPETRLPRIVLR